MHELFVEFYASHPFLAMVVLILFSGWVAVIVGVFTMCTGALINSWRAEHRRRRAETYSHLAGRDLTTKDTKRTKGEPSRPSGLRGVTPTPGGTVAMKEQTKNRIIMVAVLAIGLILIGMASTGCSTWGNGKIDPGGVVLLDLTAIDISVQWVSEDGRSFSLINEDGQFDLQAEFIEPRTGLVFVMGEGPGNITVRDPETGLQVNIKPKNPALATAQLEAAAQQAADKEEIVNLIEDMNNTNP